MRVISSDSINKFPSQSAVPSFDLQSAPTRVVFRLSRPQDRDRPPARHPERIHSSIRHNFVCEVALGYLGPPSESCLWTLAILHEHTPCSPYSTRSTGVSTPAREGSRRRLRREVGPRSRWRKILVEIKSSPTAVTLLRL